MEENIKQWRRIEVIKDYRFYIICPICLQCHGLLLVFLFINPSLQAQKNGENTLLLNLLGLFNLFSCYFINIRFFNRKFTSRVINLYEYTFIAFNIRYHVFK